MPRNRKLKWKLKWDETVFHDIFHSIICTTVIFNAMLQLNNKTLQEEKNACNDFVQIDMIDWNCSNQFDIIKFEMNIFTAFFFWSLLSSKKFSFQIISILKWMNKWKCYQLKISNKQ